MTPNVTIYAGCFSLAAAFLLGNRLLHAGEFLSPVFASLLLAGAVLSTYKVALPGIRGNVSSGFVVLLIAQVLTGPEAAAVIAAVCALAQTFWHKGRAVQPIHAAFNTAVLVLASWNSYQLATYTVGPAQGALTAWLAVATLSMFAVNTVAVAGAIALSEGKPLHDAWRRCNLRAFPCYATGVLIVAALLSAAPAAPWMVALLSVPPMYLFHSYYRDTVAANQ